MQTHDHGVAFRGLVTGLIIQTYDNSASCAANIAQSADQTVVRKSTNSDHIDIKARNPCY